MKFPAVFNPYAEYCSAYDRIDAARVRRANLRMMLDAALICRVDTIWIARDLGYRGGRRTGVPLTDDVHLASIGHLFGGIEFKRATRGPLVAERTAAIVWKVLSQIGKPVLLWNVFPLHPYEPDDQFSNRCHTAAERRSTWPLLEALIDMFQPRRLIAIGRDAQLALADLSLPVTPVRHPSYGGQGEFISALCTIYGIRWRRSLSHDLPFGVDQADMG